MKIGILGAGVSGLSLGRMLSKEFDVEILEKNNIHGGIARTRKVNSITYHPVGGHCFNSKYQDVLDFVFNEVLPSDSWHKVIRKAVIKFEDTEISYPIEFAIKQIHQLYPDLAMEMTKDFLNATDDNQYTHLEDWFRKKFGNCLSENYFIPYNEKIWNRSLKEMSPAWVEGKLPIPNKASFFNALIANEEDKMPHASFYYPNSNDQNTFIDSMAEGLNIIFNYSIEKLAYSPKDLSWLINDERQYDLIVSTLPLNCLPHLITDSPDEMKAESDKLKYNKVTTMLWRTAGTENTWTYVPKKENFFHRYIHIGSFFSPVKNYTITEVVGVKTYEEMVENGKKDPFLIEPLDYNVSDHAYVVFDENYEKATNALKHHILSYSGLYTHGRFGDWQYYNMDVCIKKSIDLANEITRKYLEVK